MAKGSGPILTPYKDTLCKPATSTHSDFGHFGKALDSAASSPTPDFTGSGGVQYADIKGGKEGKYKPIDVAGTGKTQGGK